MCSFPTRTLVANGPFPAATRRILIRTYCSHPSAFAKHNDSGAAPRQHSSSDKMTVPLEGVVAINKPSGISSAEAVRQLQRIFKPSRIFAETLAAEKARRERESENQQRRRKKQSARNVEVKIGHGGTLDPMASGVLITGIGAATKQLPGFLGCTKSYEATALLGAATDTYDTLGKIVAWGKTDSCDWDAITTEVLERELEQFRGDIMQTPPMLVPPPPHTVLDTQVLFS